jgi:hypothetical protein
MEDGKEKPTVGSLDAAFGSGAPLYSLLTLHTVLHAIAGDQTPHYLDKNTWLG